jgi:NAD(P)-dependent dehydrogenase (short-subunit alcohol dehydrogenase family)
VVEPGSAFVFISSIAAVTPYRQLVSYSASKAGMAAVMRDVAFAGQDRSIRANIIMPGGIDTGIARNGARNLFGAPEHQGQAPRGPGKLATGRNGTAWETAYLTLFLLSQESAYITGQIIALDGGITAF